MTDNWNLADVWETIAGVVGDAPALMHRDLVRTWSEFEDRSARLATAGTGTAAPRGTAPTAGARGGTTRRSPTTRSPAARALTTRARITRARTARATTRIGGAGDRPAHGGSRGLPRSVVWRCAVRSSTR